MSRKKQNNRLVKEITFNSGLPKSVDWSPDGKKLVLGDDKGGVRVLTTEGTRLWKYKPHTSQVYGVSWAPDGSRIASASDDQTIRVYDANSGEIMLRGKAGLRNWGITWSPDSKHLAWYVEENKTYIVRIFNSSTGRPEIDCKGHTSIVWKVSWSPCGNKLASGSYDHTLRIWDTGNGSCLHCLEGHNSDVLSICWSPDSLKLASVSNDMAARVWDTHKGECLFICNGHTDIVWSVAWSPRGNILATSSGDRTLRLWDANNGTELLQIGNQGHLGVSFSPCGNLLALLARNALSLLDVSDFNEAEKSPGRDTGFAAYISRQAATIGICPPKPKIKKPIWVPSFLSSEENDKETTGYTGNYIARGVVAISPDSRKIATGYKSGTVSVFDLEINKSISLNGRGHKERVNAVAISPDGSRIASASNDDTVLILSTKANHSIIRYQGHRHDVMKVCWSPDSMQIASIEYAYENQLHIWDPATAKRIKIYNGHDSQTTALDWSKNGQFIASGDSQGIIHIWDSNSTTCLKKLKFSGAMINHLRWCPNSRYLLIGYLSGTALIADTIENSSRYHWFSFSDVSALDWSPDGQFIAYGGCSDQCIMVHNAHTGEEMNRFNFRENGCNSLAWAPNGGFIVSCNIGEVLHFWDTRNLFPDGSPLVSASSSMQKALLNTQMSLLPAALAQMHRLHIFPPLSLVRDILDLLANRCETESLKTLLATNRGFQGLRDLHWSFAARIGLAALLLHRLPSSDWQPPENTTPTQIRDALIMALSGDAIKPDPPAPPVSLLTKSAELVDDRLLTLLAMLGPEAVAADPGLPLRLLLRVKEIPPLSIAQRRLLGIRTGSPRAGGQSTGLMPGADRGQIGDIQMGSLRDDFTSLLPSQLALPPLVKMYRHLRSELLFRSREMVEPPRLRPAVIFLDVSPPTFGPIEQITRLAAFTIGQPLRRAGQRVILLTNSDGIKEGQWLLELNHPADLVETWLQRTLKTVPVTRGLELARVLRAGLQENDGLEPIILVLSHPWFGAEEEIPEIKGLRGLFVQYPGSHHTPVLAPLCAKYHSIESTQFNELSSILARLMT